MTANAAYRIQRGLRTGLMRRFATMFAALALLVSGTAALAQTGTGLKLGNEEEPSGTLDLGAAPAPAAGADAGAGAAAPDSAPVDGGVKRTTFGAWEVACAGQGEGCAMAQIGNDKSGTPVLEMVIRKLDEPLEVGERTAIAVLDVITPLGVVLTEGLALVIDSGRPESAPFQICTEQGCLVREPIDADLVNRLKRGNNAQLKVVAANQGEVSAELSLSGFTKAFGSLQ